MERSTRALQRDRRYLPASQPRRFTDGVKRTVLFQPESELPLAFPDISNTMVHPHYTRRGTRDARYS